MQVFHRLAEKVVKNIIARPTPDDWRETYNRRWMLMRYAATVDNDDLNRQIAQEILNT